MSSNLTPTTTLYSPTGAIRVPFLRIEAIIVRRATKPKRPPCGHFRTHSTLVYDESGARRITYCKDCRRAVPLTVRRLKGA